MKNIVKKALYTFLWINVALVSITVIAIIIVSVIDNDTGTVEKAVEETKKEEKRDIELNASINATDNNIQITNDDSFDWVNVRIRINNKYLLTVDRIESGRTFVVGWQQFIDKKNIRFNPYTEKATELFIYSKLSDTEIGSFLATRN